MNSIKKGIKRASRTTVSVDPKSRERLKTLAEKLGISQAKCLAMLLDESDHRQRLSKMTKDEMSDTSLRKTIPEQILERLRKMENHDLVIAHLRRQEREFLNPMQNNLMSISAKLTTIIEVLSHLE